jgi:uncharacterized protein YjbI with pentapeptide repeats
MAKDELAELIKLGATAWNSWRAVHDEAPNLSGASLRGLDLSEFDFSLTDLRAADLRGAKLCDANLSGAHFEGANLFKAVLDGANLAGAFLQGALFLNCAQLVVTRNWQAAFRDEALACGAAIPPRNEVSGTTRREP